MLIGHNRYIKQKNRESTTIVGTLELNKIQYGFKSDFHELFQKSYITETDENVLFRINASFKLFSQCSRAYVPKANSIDLLVGKYPLDLPVLNHQFTG